MKRLVVLSLFLLLFSVLTSSAYANLVANGSFEQPIITNSNGWDVFSSVPGWNFGPSSTALEIQKNNLYGWSWTAKQGSQWAELDGNNNTTIYQTISTTPGTKYIFEFFFSPRPGNDDNQLAWSIGNQSGLLQSDGTSLSTTFWTRFSLEFIANSSSTNLQFQEIGKSNGLGMFLDGVSTTAVPIPGTSLAFGNRTNRADGCPAKAEVGGIGSFRSFGFSIVSCAFRILEKNCSRGQRRH